MELPSLSHRGGKDGFKTTLSPEPGLPSSSLGLSPARPLTHWGVSKQEREELNPSRAFQTRPPPPAPLGLPRSLGSRASALLATLCRLMAERATSYPLLTHESLGLKQPEIPREGMRKI